MKKKTPVFYVVDEFMRNKPAPLFAGRTLEEAQLWIEANEKRLNKLNPWNIISIKKDYI